MDCRAITTCVNYADCLAITLPRNLHHFSQIYVVTTRDDHDTQAVCHGIGKVQLLTTDLFHLKGAPFAKYEALDFGLDTMGREGWITILDSDVILPPFAALSGLQIGNLYGAKRRMMDAIAVPPDDWSRFPICNRLPWYWFSGYFQTFHADDPHLGGRAWHGSGHRTAADGDGILMNHWPVGRRVNLPFEVLHIGPTIVNWAGRRTP